MKLSRKLAIALWALLFLSVLAEDVFNFSWTMTAAYEALRLVCAAVLVFGWFLADAKEREFEPSIWLKIAVVGIGLIALPYYKFRYFGVRAGFTFIGIVLLAFIATLAVALFVDYLMLGRYMW